MCNYKKLVAIFLFCSILVNCWRSKWFWGQIVWNFNVIDEINVESRLKCPQYECLVWYYSEGDTGMARTIIIYQNYGNTRSGKRSLSPTVKTKHEIAQLTRKKPAFKYMISFNKIFINEILIVLIPRNCFFFYHFRHCNTGFSPYLATKIKKLNIYL